MAFHKVHCPRCGRVMDASELAFDFGSLLNMALEKMSRRHFGASIEWYDLTGLNLCLYLTLQDLIDEYDFQVASQNTYQGRFIFTSEKLQQQLLKLANNPQTNIDILAGNIGIEYENLTKFMATSREVDIDELAEKIQEIANRVKTNMNTIIAYFDVTVIMDKDDMGNSFANKLEVTFDDGSKKTISKFICKGKDGRPCGKELYGHAGKFKEIVIGLAGTARVGKTAYLASLLASIMREGNGYESLGYDQDVITTLAYAGEGWSNFKQTLLTPYVTGKKIEKTPVIRETSENKEAIPMFSLTFRINSSHRNFIFTFVDMPGEIYDGGDADFVAEQREIIRSANMIWLCISPAQIDPMHAAATADPVNTNIMEVLANIETTMQAIKMERKIPAVVLITRSDEALESYDLFHSQFNPFTSATNPMHYLSEKNEKTPWVNEKGALFYNNMKWFIQKSYNYLNSSKGIVAQIGNIFSSFTPFAVASYGYDLDNPLINRNNESGLPIPSMIEGPFLWTLAYLGIIPSYIEKMITKERDKFFGFKKETYQELANVKIDGYTRNELFYYPIRKEEV